DSFRKWSSLANQMPQKNLVEPVVNTWGVSMDVAHFSPSEISLGVRDGFLEVRGKHEEKPDQHGFISRCFTRKYRLPAEVGAATIVARLSVDGVLTVEAPVPETAVPATFFIPIQVITAFKPKHIYRKTERQCLFSMHFRQKRLGYLQMF
uniref:SHSP domain-containing protein n=1 Tax=Oryzias latipes TaxID=8090 RepID=A0A3P9JMU0_ORYLA